MAIGTDFQIDYTNKRVYHDSGTTVYSTNAFYSWLMDTFDELAQLDDPVPMEAPSAQQYRMINGWFMADADFKFLKGDNGGTKDGGSVETVGQDAATYADGIRVLTCQSGGYTNCVAGDIGKVVTGGTTGDTGTLLAYDNTLRKWWVRTDALGDAFDVGEALTIGSGTGAGTTTAASATGENLWANLYSIGSDTDISSITLYLEQDGSAITISDIWQGYSAGHIDLLIKVKESGSLIDSGNVTVHAREWTYTFDWYTADLSNGGRLPAPIAVASDANNTTAVGTVDGWTTLTVTHGATTEDVDQSGSAENYEVDISLASTYTVANAYEKTKALSRRGQTGLQDGVEGQLYKTANASYAVVKANPFGSFAGGKFFGARGVFFELDDRPASQANLYELIDSDGNTGIAEPTSISVAITGYDSSDRLFLAKTDTGVLDEDQYTTAASGNSTSSATVTISGSPDTDTPSAGVIRLQGKRYTYQSVSGSVFTLNTTDHPSGLDEDNNSVSAYVPYLDHLASVKNSVSVTAPASNQNILCRVRQKGIIPFETTGAVDKDNGYSVQAIRTTDGVVT